MRPLRSTITLFVYALLWLPAVPMVVYSFNSGEHILLWKDFSLRWYQDLASRAEVLDAVGTSLKIASLSAITATALGLGLAIALRRYIRRFRSAIRAHLHVPLIMPDIVLAVALGTFFALLEVRTGWWTVYLGHTAFNIAFVYVIASSRLQSYSFKFEAAAMDLGATSFYTFRTITLPLLFPTILVSFVIAFTLSVDDTVIALFTSGVGSTVISVLLFSMTKFGVSPLVNALATSILVTVWLLVATILIIRRISWRVMRREVVSYE